MTTILLVEDNHLNLEMFSRRLERKGFTVLCAADGREAVQKAHAERPDLILMDLSLPVMDGWEAARKLKGDPATRSIPVIALTAHAMVGDREKALKAGCDDYETKPVDLARLQAKIGALLGRSGSSAPAAPERAASRPTIAPPAGRAPAPPPRSAAQPARTTPEGGYPPAVLVVDDNQLNRDMLSRRLEREGYYVTLARDGQESLHLVQQQAFDLVLLDMMMPGMNGLEVLSVLRASYSLVELPVIIVTAKDQSEDMVAALRSGANDYVTKPFNFPVLLARLQNQLQIKRGRPSAPESAAPARLSAAQPALPRVPTFASASRPVGVAVSAPPSLQQASTVNLTPRTEHGSRGGSHAGDHAPGRGAARPGGPIPSEGRARVAGYEILGELGRGGMGVVYKARHAHMGRVVALKVINKEHLLGATTIQRFYREIKAAAQLSHPNIVMAFDAGQFDDTHYFAMEYVEGSDLSRLVREQGPLPIAHACSFVSQAALGLQHAYERGLVHRDIKPSNLFVAWNNPPATGAPRGLPPLDRATLKILDLGLALLYEPTPSSEAACGITRDGRVIGTADYMAPEQWMNAHKVDIRADLYALGGTFYYLLTGQLPFPGAEPMEKMLKHHLDEPTPAERLRPGIPLVVLSALRRLMAKSPDHRFQQPVQVAETLKVIQG